MATKQRPNVPQAAMTNAQAEARGGSGAVPRRAPGPDRYALVTDAMTEGIYDWSVTTGVLEVTPRLNAIIGMSEGALTAADWNARVHPDDFETYRAALRAYFKGETAALACEYRIRRKTGDYIWVADHGRVVRDDTGRAVRLVGAITDITAHKLAEASLRRSEERYALAMEAVNEGVYDWNVDAGTIYYSDGVRRALGFSPEQLRTPDDWVERIHPDDRARWRDALVAHFKRQTDRFECEFRYRGADGSWRWARQHGIAQFDLQGRAYRVIGATGDITEIKRQQAAAAKAREQLAQAIDSISEGFAIYDDKDRLVLCNEQYRKVYPGLEHMLRPGVTYEEVLRGVAASEILDDVGADPEKWVRQRLHRHLNPGVPYEQQLRDGRWVKIAWRKTRDGGIAGVFTDITALKQVEFALRESEQRYVLAMESANEAFWDWDVDAGTIMVAPRFAAQFGLSIDDRSCMTTAHWASRIHPEDVEKFRDAIRAHLRGETEFYTCEFRTLDANDEYIWVYHRGLGQRGEDGRVYRMAGTTTDITARKEAELALVAARADAERAQQQLKDAIESISEGLVLFDRDDRIVVCNSNYRQYFMDAVGEGVARLVVPGASFWDILRAAHRAGMFPDLVEVDFDDYMAKREERRRTGAARNAVEQHLCDGRWLQINEHKTADGGIASVYVDITEIKEKSATLEGLSGKLAKYLPPQVYDMIFSGAQTAEVTSKRKKLTVFFSDIADFTATADMLESEELTALLNQYLTEMSKIAHAHGATIDKFIGDAILAFFGDPVSMGVKEDATACVQMAIAMQQRMGELRQEWRGRGLDQAFEMRVGITTGFCTVGNFGSSDRVDYTVIGNPVNLAARLQVRAPRGGILLDAETNALVGDQILTEAHDTLELKGIPRPVRTYKVLGIYDELEGEGRVFRRNAAGLRIELDQGRLDDAGRQEAIDALTQALALLGK